MAEDLIQLLTTQYKYSDYQKSERDFAFIVDKEVKAQDLINASKK